MMTWTCSNIEYHGFTQYDHAAVLLHASLVVAVYEAGELELWMLDKADPVQGMLELKRYYKDCGYTSINVIYFKPTHGIVGRL